MVARPSCRLTPVLASLILVGLTAGCGPSTVPLDARPNSSSEAEDLAYSVATKAGCGSLEALDPAGTQLAWHFTCQRSTSSYDIAVFGSNDSRTSGLKSLQDAGQAYVARSYYAVTFAPSFPAKGGAASPSQSVLDPFR